MKNVVIDGFDMDLFFRGCHNAHWYCKIGVDVVDVGYGGVLRVSTVMVWCMN